MHYYIAEAEADEEDYIMRAECCMKQSIQLFLHKWTNKKLTDAELKFVTIYECLLLTTLSYYTVQYQLIAYCLKSVLTDTQLIIMVALFFNTLLFIQMVENIKEVARAFLCECDYREHPELEDER
jgi:hypothetical protein